MIAMSENDSMAAYYAESEMLEEPDMDMPYGRTNDEVWVTKDERAIPIKDLDNDHLVNIVLMLARKAPYAVAAVAQTLKDLVILFDGHPKFSLLVKEVRKRGLSKVLAIKLQPVLETLKDARKRST